MTSHDSGISEIRSLEAAVGLLVDDPRETTVRVRGRDSLKFLQGLCTQDLRPLSDGQGSRAMFLTGKGQVIALASVYRIADEYRLGVDVSAAAALVAHLRKYIIAAAVEVVEALPTEVVSCLAGPSSSPVLEEAGILPPGSARWAGVVDHPNLGPVVYLRTLPETRAEFRLLFPSTQERSLGERHLVRLGIPLELAKVSLQAVESVRVRAAIPRFGVDIDESVLPAESGLESEIVSYTKGCYSGQEVVAKQRYLGRPRKRLTSVGCREGEYRVGDQVTHLGQRLGRITSVSTVGDRDAWRALVILKNVEIPAEALLEFLTETGEVRGRGVVAPPLVFG